jgi:hypothetical protein
MSLTFAGLNSDRVEHGSAAALDNLAIGTAVFWAMPHVVTNFSRNLYGKAKTVAGSIQFWQRGADGTSLRMEANRATTTQSVNSTTGQLAANAWRFCVVQWNITSGGPKIFVGKLSRG